MLIWILERHSKVLFKIDAGDEAQKALLRTDYISRYMVNGRINSQTVQTLFPEM